MGGWAGQLKREGIYVSMQPIHFVLQHCKATNYIPIKKKNPNNKKCTCFN